MTGSPDKTGRTKHPHRPQSALVPGKHSSQEGRCNSFEPKAEGINATRKIQSSVQHAC